MLLHPWVHHLVKHQSNWDSSISSVLSAYGVFYGITLALIVVAAYQDYAQVSGTVAREAAALGILYRDVTSYLEPIRAKLSYTGPDRHCALSPAKPPTATGRSAPQLFIRTN